LKGGQRTPRSSEVPTGCEEPGEISLEREKSDMLQYL